MGGGRLCLLVSAAESTYAVASARMTDPVSLASALAEFFRSVGWDMAGPDRAGTFTGSATGEHGQYGCVATPDESDTVPRTAPVVESTNATIPVAGAAPAGTLTAAVNVSVTTRP